MLVTLSRRFGKELELLAMVPAGNNVIKTAFTAQKMKFTIVINKSVKDECVERGLFLFLQITQDLNKVEKHPAHPVLDNGK